MTIRPDGKVSLCCNDALGKVTLGDLNANTVQEIYHNDNYRKFRSKVLEGRIHEIKLCRYCDSMHYVL